MLFKGIGPKSGSQIYSIEHGPTHVKWVYRRPEILSVCERALALLRAPSSLMEGREVFTKKLKCSLSGIEEIEVVKRFLSRLPVSAGNRLEKAKAEEVVALWEQIRPTSDKEGLKMEEVLQMSLVPTHRFTIDNLNYYCSIPFFLDEDARPAVLCLVDTEDGVYPRIFYLSNSQGAWRVLAAIEEENQGEGDYYHYGKGIQESDTNLPIALNLALFARGRFCQPLTLSKSQLKRLFGTVEIAYDYSQGYNEVIQITDLFQEPKGGFKSKHEEKEIVPSEVGLPTDPLLHPDFSSSETEEIVLPRYGDVYAKVFFSLDRSLKYLFYELKVDQRAFLISVELVKCNPLTVYGVRSHSPALHDADSPLLEYWWKIPIGFRPEETREDRQDHYSVNWSFIRLLPIIQLYYSAQNREVPDPM